MSDGAMSNELQFWLMVVTLVAGCIAGAILFIAEIGQKVRKLRLLTFGFLGVLAGLLCLYPPYVKVRRLPGETSVYADYAERQLFHTEKPTSIVIKDEKGEPLVFHEGRIDIGFLLTELIVLLLVAQLSNRLLRSLERRERQFQLPQGTVKAAVSPPDLAQEEKDARQE